MKAANDRFYARRDENLKQLALGCLFAAVAIVVIAAWIGGAS